MRRNAIVASLILLLFMSYPAHWYASAIEDEKIIPSAQDKAPRLLFDSEDLERIRREINSSDYLKNLWEHVKDRCDSILSEEISVFTPHLWNPILSKYRSWAVTLAVGYAISGEEKYARKAADLLRTIFKVQEMYGRIDPETIHIGYATHTFLLAYDSIQPSNVLTEEDISRAKRFFKQIGFQLRDAMLRHRGNWAMCEATGLVQIALYFPEFAQSEEWLNAGKKRMEELMLIDFADDGGELELAPNYVQLCCYMVGIFAEVMRRFEGIDYYSISFGQKTIQDMFRWLLYIMTPGGIMPAIHDSRRSVWNIGIFELGAARYRDGILKFAARKAFDWVRRAEEIGLGGYMPGGFEYALIWADETVKPVEPRETTVLLPSSGFAVFRTSWNLNAHYLIYKYGPFGIGHQHYDKHSVEIWAYGSPLVLDAGTMHYGDPRHKVWDIQTISHNTVMVGLGSQRRCDGYLNYFEDSSNISLVSASAETYEGVIHSRTIIFDKLLGCYIFVDELRSNREHLYAWLWHVRGYTEFPVKAPEVSWRTPEGVGLSLIFSNPELLDVEFGSGPCSDFGAIPYVSLKSQGKNVTFIALVVPYVGSKPHARISSLLSESGLAVKVELRNRTSIYLMPYTGRDVVKVQGLEAEANLAFLEEQGGYILRFGALNASSLRVHNLTLFRSDARVSLESAIETRMLKARVKAHNLTTLSIYTGLHPTTVLLNGSKAETEFKQGYLTLMLKGKTNDISISCPNPISMRVKVAIESKTIQFILPSLAKYLLRYSPILVVIASLAAGLFYFFLQRRRMTRLPIEERETRLRRELEMIEARYSAGEIPHAVYNRMKEEIRRELEMPRMPRESPEETLTEKLRDLKERYQVGEISYQRYLLEKRKLEEEWKKRQRS